MKTKEQRQGGRLSLAAKLCRGARKFLAMVLSVSMVAVNMPAISAIAANNDGSEDVQEFSITSEDLKEALQDALLKGDTVNESDYKFTGIEQETYEDLFFGADVYELFPDIDDDKNGKLSLKVFLRLTADRELDLLDVFPEDEIIFLLQNRSDEEQSARIYVDDSCTDVITVVKKADVVLSEPDKELQIKEAGIADEASVAVSGSASEDEDISAPEERDETENVPETDDIPEADEVPAEYVSEAEAAVEAPSTSAGGAGGSGSGADVGYTKDASSYSEDQGESTSDAEMAEDGGESYENGNDGYEAGVSDDTAAESGDSDSAGGSSDGAGVTSGETAGNEGTASDGSGSSDGSDAGESADTGSDSGKEHSGSTDNSGSGSESSESGTDNGSGSSDSNSESSGSSSGSSGGSSASSGSSESSDNSGSSESSSGSSQSDSSGSGGGESSGSSSSASSDSGSESSGSSSSESSSGRGSDKSQDTASISIHRIGLLAAALDDIVIEIDDDEVTANISGEDNDVAVDSSIVIEIDGDKVTANVTGEDDDAAEDSVVVLASSSDVDEDDKSNKIDGEVCDAVIVNARRSCVAFVTSLENLGMEEGMAIEGAVFTASDGDINVTVAAPAGALPENAELSVTRYYEDSEEYAEAAEAIKLDAETTGMAALDISFLVDGEEVEPEDEVQVMIDVSNILPEDADAGTLKVTHLEEKSYLFGLFDRVKTVVVADEDEGYIDEDNGIITFSVENFSVFTVTWDDGTGTTIEVHVYSMNGTSIDEELNVESYTSTSSVITISDLVSHLTQNAAYTNTYTYRYTTVVYETQQGGGYSSTIIGGQDNSVSSISKSGTTYTVTTSSGTTTVTDPAAIVIHLYYSIPEVTLATEDPYAETVEFTTSNNYFVGDTSDATYTWALSDDTLGTLTHPTSGQATFTWADSAQSGDQVTVTVTMTVGEETASDTYTLTYGDDPITFTVYAQDGTTPQANARVALVDASGTVATGTTGADGTVTLYAPAGEYTVGVTYVYLVSEAGGGSTSRATAETTITVSDDQTATGSVTLGTAVTSGPDGDTSGSNGGDSEPYYYEHIDVKVAAAETSDSDVSFSDLDAVYVYDKYGNLLYVSDDINANPGTTDYNVLFDINGNEDQHSIVVSSEDTIVLVYEVVNNETGEYSTYTSSYRSGETYPADEYYPATAINAYQLYNILYNANYASQEAFEAAWGEGLEGYNAAGISISGYSYTLIADYLCDTRTTTGQAGLDFVIYVQELEATQDDFDFRVAKTVNNVPDTLESEDIENFTFTLQELDKVQDDGEWTEAIWSTADGNVLSTDTDTISSFTQNSDGTWSGVLDFLGALQYEAEDGTNFFYYILSEQTPTTATPTQQYYGLKVTVTYTAATGTATIVVSYCSLGTQDDYPYYRTSGWTGLTAYTDTDDDGEEYTYYSIPFVNTYSTTGFELEKVDDSSNPLDGAVFSMTTTQIEGEGTTLYFTSKTVDGTLTYTLASSTTEGASTDIAVTNGGPVSIQGMAAGTYTLTETTTPDGYATVDSFTVIISIDENGSKVVTVKGDNVSVKEGSDTVTVTNNEVTEITVAKKWVDDDNANGTRPESITVTITGSDGNTYTLTLSDENEWSDTQKNLPVYDSNGTKITYEVTEETVAGYTGIVTDNGNGTYTITNTFETINISGTKEWSYNEDAGITLPESIMVYLYADYDDSEGAVNEPIDNTPAVSADNWAWSFPNLPKYQSDGETEIKYAVLEGEISGYLPTYVYETDEDGNMIITITNAIPEIHKYVSDPTFGESTDDLLHEDEADNNNTLEYRMEADHIGGAHDLTLHDYLDEDQLDMKSINIVSVTLYEDENDETGTELTQGTDYTYSTDTCNGEDCGLEGCSFEIHIIDDDLEDLSPDAYVIVLFDIDLHEGVENFDDNQVDEIDNWVGLSFTVLSFATFATPEETETYSYGFDLYKYDSDSNEPLAGVEFILSKDGADGTVYAQFETDSSPYLLSDWTASRDDAMLIVTASDGNAVIEGLHDGTFFIEETKAPAGYQQLTGIMEVIISVDENDPDNPTITATSETVEGTRVMVANTPTTSTDGNNDSLEIIGFKTWAGDSAEDRPSSITIRLHANGEVIETKVVIAEDNWSWNFSNLPVYDDDGFEIDYTITEDAVDDYNTSYDGYNVTNTYTPGETSLSVAKSWNDDHDSYGDRPDSITIELLKDGNVIDTIKLSGDNHWTASFTGLDENSNYTVREVSVSGYTNSASGNASAGYVFTNTHSSNSGNNGSTHHSSGGGGGGGGSSSSSGGGSGSGGPGDGGSGDSGEGETWDLLPIPSTGEDKAVLFGATAFAVSAMALVVLLWRKRRENQIN